MHIKDLKLLESIQQFFGAGTILFDKRKNGSYNFIIVSLDHILNIVIPHFEKFPLITQKYADFLLWKQVAILIDNKEHLTKEGLQTIINHRATINIGLHLF